jgi:hypothetical protein
MNANYYFFIINIIFYIVEKYDIIIHITTERRIKFQK